MIRHNTKTELNVVFYITTAARVGTYGVTYKYPSFEEIDYFTQSSKWQCVCVCVCMCGACGMCQIALTVIMSQQLN